MGPCKHSGEMRLFIAINLNDEMKDALIDIQHAMREHGVRGRETPPDNMHLTLAFIGDHDDPSYVKEVVQSIDFSPFDMRLSGIGAFGDLWWAGIEDSEPLRSVAKRLRRALADADIPFDRKKFSPHITIIRRARGRLDSMDGVDGPAFGDPANGISESFGTGMTVDRISLMRSDRGKNGMIYTEL